MVNVLLFDVYSAHADFGKNILETGLKEDRSEVYVKYNLRNIESYIV